MVAVVATLAVLVVGLMISSASGAEPGRPTDVSAQGGDREVTVLFRAPSDSGAPVEGYDVSLNGSAWLPLQVSDGTAPELAGTVGGLAAGTTYAARVRAVGPDGTSEPSMPSADAEATTDGDPLEVDVQAYPGDGQVTVTLDDVDDEQQPSGWRVVAEPDDPDLPSRYAVCPGASRRCTVVGLTDEQPYALSVVPFTSQLPGSLSAQTVDGVPLEVATVTPSAGPQAPTDLVATGLDGALQVRFTAPALDASGERADEFEYAAGDDADFAPLDATSDGDGAYVAEVPDLTNGEATQVAVRAVDDVGPGAAATVEGTPAGPPTRVRDPEVDIDGNAVRLRWEAPRDDGGADIRAYVVSARFGNPGCTTERLTCTIRGVDFRRAFRFTVSADNATDGLPDTGLGPATNTRTVGPRR